MTPNQWIFTVCVLCLGLLSVANTHRRSCRCVDDRKHSNYGSFLCRSMNLVTTISEFPENQCMNISIASFEENRFSEYPLILKDRRFKIIYLSDNKLRLLPHFDQLSRNTKYLDISRNKISNSSDELKNMTGLKTLLLSGNSLRSLEFLPDPCGLEELDLSGNAISGIDSSLRRCTTLTKLNLAKNRLTSLPSHAFESLRFLESLHLGKNPLTTLVDGTFIGLIYLRRLSLPQARISNIHRATFSGLWRLEYLDLSGNSLDITSSDAFKEVPNLTNLFLERNRLSSLPDHLLSNHTRMRYLILRDNDFSSIPSSLIMEDRPILMEIEMKENPVLPTTLGWVFSRDDVQKDVIERQCNCGVIARHNVVAVFCINAQCGGVNQPTDWKDIVRSAQAGNDASGEDTMSNFAL